MAAVSRAHSVVNFAKIRSEEPREPPAVATFFSGTSPVFRRSTSFSISGQAKLPPAAVPRWLPLTRTGAGSVSASLTAPKNWTAEKEDQPERRSFSSESRLGTSNSFSEGRVIRSGAKIDELWLAMRVEARLQAEQEPALASYIFSAILAHKSLERALAYHLGNKLGSDTLLSTQLATLMIQTFNENASICEAVRADLRAVRERDPACSSFVHCFLNFKGFQAIQTHRVSHKLWLQGRASLALALQSRASEAFHVDIHPAAQIGQGFLLDHATGVVVGETTVIGDNVSILHDVTLGGTGAVAGDRHPKIGNGVLIGAGAKVLGNVRVGNGAKIGAGSVVLTHVPDGATAVGVPARVMKRKQTRSDVTVGVASREMDQTSFIYEWCDFVI